MTETIGDYTDKIQVHKNLLSDYYDTVLISRSLQSSGSGQVYKK